MISRLYTVLVTDRIFLFNEGIKLHVSNDLKAVAQGSRKL